MNGGSGSKFSYCSVNVGSGVDTATDLDMTSVSTTDAGDRLM
jgi:hypothetical protein